MIPKTKPEDLAKAVRIISEWFEEQAANSVEDASHWDNVIRARALDEAAAEIERLREKCNQQATILRRLTPENFPDTLFIHTVLGEKDQNGMPEKLLVVPSYGCDFSYVYERTDKTTGPEW